MAWKLNDIDLSIYGIIAGHSPGSNIALQGCFDLPARIGDTHHIWADDNSLEPFTDSDDIFFGGRDIIFYGSIFGTNTIIINYLQSLYDAIHSFTDLVIFSTPYGDFSIQVKSIVPEFKNGACSVIINFRELVAILTGGELPAIGSNNYTIDAIPFVSFGLYYSKGDGQNNLPELKDQFFTKYGSEGYQISKYKNKSFEFNCTLIATGLSDFQDKIKALYLLFKSAGTHNIKLNDEINIDCFAIEGFKIESIYINNTMAIAKFKAHLTCYSVNYINQLLTEASEELTTEESVKILI